MLGERNLLFRELAVERIEKHLGIARFLNVHVRYNPDDNQESWEAGRVFGHAAYPHVDGEIHEGPLEVYRAVRPVIEELEKQATESNCWSITKTQSRK